MDTTTYLTTVELARRIKYEERYIRDTLKDSVLLEGIHYIRPFGKRKTLYIWEVIERDMVSVSKNNALIVPLKAGGSCRG